MFLSLVSFTSMAKFSFKYLRQFCSTTPAGGRAFLRMFGEKNEGKILVTPFFKAITSSCEILISNYPCDQSRCRLELSSSHIGAKSLNKKYKYLNTEAFLIPLRCKF
jgi:hypothetical protein